MKIVRRIAATLALCGTAFFTNMAHAGDCGYWEIQGFWSTSNVEILGSGGVPPASGPGTSTFIATGATFVEQSCGGPPDNGGPGTILQNPQINWASRIAAGGAFCKKSETCEAWEKRLREVDKTCQNQGVGPESANECKVAVGLELSETYCSNTKPC